MMLTTQALTQYDPTRTLTLRNNFSRDLTRRFRQVTVLIRHTVVNDDIFNLARPVLSRNFQGDLSTFLYWLDAEVRNIILETWAGTQITRLSERMWTNTYVRAGYQRGIGRARQEMKNVGYNVPSIELGGGMESITNNPFHLNKLGLLYSRTFNELKGITDIMSQQISRVLSQALLADSGVQNIMHLISHIINGPITDLTGILGRFVPTVRKSQLMARTELVRSHHLATIQEYRNFDVHSVKVLTEHTPGVQGTDPCADLIGKIFTLDEIESMIPLHTGCRCCAVPIAVAA